MSHDPDLEAASIAFEKEIFPEPTSGNDEVEAMCAWLEQGEVGPDNHFINAAALLRKQAAQIAELQKDAVGLEAAFSVRTVSRSAGTDCGEGIT